MSHIAMLKKSLKDLVARRALSVEVNGFKAKLLDNPYVGKIIVIEKDGQVFQRRTVDAAAAIMENID